VTTKARQNTNPRKTKPGANMNRPNGAGSMADTNDPRQLVEAALYGNRATRRLARRNLKKQLRRPD
jgi:hypothetical protein